MTKYQHFSKMFSQSINAVFARVTVHSTACYDKKMEKIVEYGSVFGALLTDLSKAFDYIPHDLFVAKLEAYGFQTDALNLVYDYLSNRKQIVKINQTFSCWKDIGYGVPQRSISVHYYSIYIYVTFFTSLKI